MTTPSTSAQAIPGSMPMAELLATERKLKTLLRCSFCNKSRKEVKLLIAGPMVYICNECAGTCCNIIAEETAAAKPGDAAADLLKQADQQVQGAFKQAPSWPKPLGKMTKRELVDFIGGVCAGLDMALEAADVRDRSDVLARTQELIKHIPHRKQEIDELRSNNGQMQAKLKMAEDGVKALVDAQSKAQSVLIKVHEDQHQAELALEAERVLHRKTKEELVDVTVKLESASTDLDALNESLIIWSAKANESWRAQVRARILKEAP